MMRRRRPRQTKQERKKKEMEEWKPKTKLGKAVLEGKIKSIDEIFAKGLRIREPEIVDKLIPELQEEVLAVGTANRPFMMVQRMTDSGRRNNFVVIVAVGNGDGYIGLGQNRAKEYGSALRKALKTSKMNLVNIRRGCGSWECSCSKNHSLPFKSRGKSGSVRIDLKPAPNGLGLAASSTTKTMLKLAGVKDIWCKTYGHSKTRRNLALATFDALKNLSRIKAA